MPPSLGWRFCFFTLSILSALPLFLVDYPPIQDLPQHLAAIQVLHGYADPGLGFRQYFDLDLFRTQYLTYYLAAHLLAYPCGVALANKLLLAAALLATPHAASRLLFALGRDQRLALLVFPLLYNAHLILGFFNFIAAIPLALYGLALTVQQRRQPSPGRALLLAALALVTFFTHVVPFAFLALGALLLGVGAGLKATVVRLLPLLPAAAGAIFWALRSPAGRSTLTAARLRSSSEGPRPVYRPWAEALRDLPAWMTDVFTSRLDQWLLLAWAALMVLIFVFGVFGALKRSPSAGRPPPQVSLLLSLGRRLWLLPPVAAICYLAFPVSYDWIWPIAQRFALLAAIFLVPLMPAPRRAAGGALFSAAVLLAALGFYQVARDFRRFDREEVGRFDAALGTIPPGQRVAGLIFDRGSRTVKFSPFIHYVAYYQAQRGGAVMFSFADFPHSPFRFREDNRPPRVRPRWEWMPERVNPAADLGWYDYVLVRGGPGLIDRQRRLYRPVFRSGHWSVWRRLKPVWPSGKVAGAGRSGT